MSESEPTMTSRDRHLGRTVAMVTLGCARNEVDSEELAARLSRGGWTVTTDVANATVVLVNTCGFIEKAQQDSIDTLLEVIDTGASVIATGCLAERYGKQLSDSLPEVTAVLGFDHYPDIADRLDLLMSGATIEPHIPGDRRVLFPPAFRDYSPQPPEYHHDVMRMRLTEGPVAPLKIANGCNRRCAFCSIPSFRGSFVSRLPEEILAEAEWLARSGVRELVLVSENSTSYGSDLRQPRLLKVLLDQLVSIEGIVRVRVSYLQPAEVWPGLIEAIATTPGVAPYFDLSFQHASEGVLRRMRRFGSTERFLDQIASIRALADDAGIRSNVIVGFPGETRSDIAELERFLTEAQLDAIGVFDYSDEEGTEASTLLGKVSSSTIARRYSAISELAERLCARRAEQRHGSQIEVLVDTVEGCVVEGRAAHQAPDVDGTTTLIASEEITEITQGLDPSILCIGDLVRCVVVGSNGVDLVAVPHEMISPSGCRECE